MKKMSLVQTLTVVHFVNFILVSLFLLQLICINRKMNSRCNTVVSLWKSKSFVACLNPANH